MLCAPFIRVGLGSRDNETLVKRCFHRGVGMQGFLGEVSLHLGQALGTRRPFTRCPPFQLPRGVGPVLRHHHAA